MNLRYTVPAGAVTLSNVRITGFSVENQFDGESFNRSGRRETITGTAIITGNPLDSGTGSIDTVRNLLNTPRGKLELQFAVPSGSWTLLVDGSLYATTNQDARNGPIPSVSVSRIEGNQSAAVTFVSFSFSYFGCGSTRIQKFEMSMTQSLDEAGFITMTRTGSIKVSARTDTGNTIYTPGTQQIIPTAGDADNGNSPDLYRNLISGKPGPFFRRIRQDYTLDSSLTTLSFTIEDRMVFREMKFPVMMGDASFTYERALGGASFLGTKTFNAHFEGGPNTPPGDLLKVAIEAAAARIDFQNDLVQSIQVREPNIYSRNRIEMTVVAQGMTDQPVDIKLVRQMFTDPHTLGATRYVAAYPNGGYYINSVTGLRWDPCQVPNTVAEIVSPNPASDSETESTLTVIDTPADAEIEQPTGEPVTKPLEPDTGMPNPDNRVKHLDGQQDFHTEDSGMRFIEATGGQFQWPLQVRMPQVVVTQTVRYISNTQSAPVPYPDIGEPFLVLNERISVNNAPPDVSGKPVFAVVATRQIQVQSSSSPNTRSSDTGTPRRVWSPTQLAQSRNLYSSNNTINAQQIDSSGNPKRLDYTSG